MSQKLYCRGRFVPRLSMQLKYPLAALLLLVRFAFPQNQSEKNVSADELVRGVITNELQMQDQDHSRWIYEEETVKSGVKETKEVAGTKGGAVALLIARNGRPLSEDELKKQEEQMNAFIHDRQEQEKRRRAAEEDAAKTKRLLSMLPDAFHFSYAEGSGDGDTVRLNFKPNPAYHPPSREAQVFHEMEGTLTVDRKEKRLVEINGKLMHEVKFFGGLLGHLDQGGTFDVRQVRVGPNHWEIQRLNVDMKGKALFFKTISVQQDETHGHFQQLPDDISLGQAADLLVKDAAHRRSSRGAAS